MAVLPDWEHKYSTLWFLCKNTCVEKIIMYKISQNFYVQLHGTVNDMWKHPDENKWESSVCV